MKKSVQILAENKKYHALGRQALRKFIKISHFLLINKRKKYDLIVGPGDSGVMMIYFLQRIADEFDIRLPKTMAIPIYRYASKFPLPNKYQDKIFDNTVLLPYVRKKIISIPKLSSILFIDDEVYKGRSLATCLELIKKASRRGQLSNTLECDIIADDHGFARIKPIPGVRMHLYPLGHEVSGYNNVIIFSIPRTLTRLIARQYPSKEDCRQERVNLLLGLPIKEIKKGIPQYNKHPFLQLRKKMPDYNKIHSDALLDLDKQIHQIATILQQI